MINKFKDLFAASTYGAKFFRSIILIFSLWQITIIFAVGVYIYYNDLSLRREIIKNLSANINLILETKYAYYLEHRGHIPEVLEEEFYFSILKNTKDEVFNYFDKSIYTFIGPKPILSTSPEDLELYQEIDFPAFNMKYYVGFFKGALFIWHIKLLFPLVVFTVLITTCGLFILYRLYRSFKKPMEGLVLSLSMGKVPEYTGYTELDKVVRAINEYVEREKKLTEDKMKLLKDLEKSQRLSAIGTLAGGYAHEFNNLLQAVLINTELAKRALKEGDYAKAEIHLGQVEAVSSRGQNLAKRILHMTKIAPGEEASLREVLIELQDVLRVLIPRDIELEVSIDEDPLYVPISPDALHEIIINYVKNAVDAIEAVRDYERGFKIQIRAYRKGALAVLEVEDNGCGMTDEVKEKIFEPFFTTKKIPEGTGLGLYVIYNIVTQAGGYIEVESTPGLGTVFKTFLPLRERSFRAKEDEHPRSDDKVSAQVPLKRVLIADDEKEIAEALGEIFATYNIEVTISHDGNSAYDLISKEKFDLILLDLYMPGLNGVDLIKKLREAQVQLPPIVLMTGFVGDAGPLLTDLLEKGVIKRILRKPFSIEEIESIIKEYQRMPS